MREKCGTSGMGRQSCQKLAQAVVSTLAVHLEKLSANGTGALRRGRLFDSAEGKLRPPPPHTLLNQRAIATVGFRLRCNHNRGGYAVAGLHIEEADALRVAAGFADRGRVHADDFAVVADQHDL